MSFVLKTKLYFKSTLKNDLIAGITVGVLLIPQGMAYAILAGLPPIYGLYAALIPQLVYFFLGTSSKLAVGPVATDALLVATSLSLLNIQNQQEYILYAITLSFFIGSLQIIMSGLKLGFIVNFLSKPVINGFTSAVAILIIISQSKIFFSGQLLSNLSFNKSEILIGLFTLVIALLSKKYIPKIPNALLLVTLSIILSYFFYKPEYPIKLIGKIPNGLPSFVIPQINYTSLKTLFWSALTIAFIGFVEAMSINKALEEQHVQKETEPNKELLALGASNLIGSFFQSFPISGGFSRTAVNVQSGAKTKFRAVFSIIVLVLVLLFLTPVFYYLPKVVLASIIIISVFKLIDFNFPKQLWKNNKQEFLLLIFTFLTTLFIGIKEGVGLGVVASLFLMIYKVSRPHIAVLGNLKGTAYYKNINRFEDDVMDRDDLLIIRFDAQLYFGNKDYFKNQFLTLLHQKPKLKGIILNAEAIHSIDSSANAMLLKLFTQLKSQNITIYIAGAIGPLRDVFFSNGVANLLGDDSFFVKTHEAVCFFDHQCTPSQIQKKISCQSTV